MKNVVTFLFFLCAVSWGFAQAGHIMQGVGSVNMSMGGAATGQPLDISGALQWNPAAITVFDQDQIRLDVGLFFSSPELSSSIEFPPGSGQEFSGTTEDDRGMSPLPALAYKIGSTSRHHFGFSAFGISGFGVTFPESNTNPINLPPNPEGLGGFGRVESNYSLFQVGAAYAYELSEKFSIGVQPTFNFASLDLMPNPTANPTQEAGYPSTDGASTAFGFGAQFGVFYDSGSGFKAGAAYKTTQTFGDFEFDNVYLDGSTGTNKFNLDYPSILSFGVGYSTGAFDLALDYRLVNYENTDGFEAAGWTQTASVAGFGWQNINIISAGVQYSGIDRLPLRLGYTYSSNPIQDDLAFFSIPATAIIKNAFQFGLGYEISDRFEIDGVFHFGSSGDATSGPFLNPEFISPDNPNGVYPGLSEVSYDMTTFMFMFGAQYSW